MSDFDPRFNPAYQRGFEGPADAPAAAPRSQASPPASLIGTPPVTATPQVRPAQGIASAEPTREAAAAPTARTPFADSLPHDPFDDDEPPRRNPFLIVLTVIAVALVGGGLYLISQLRGMLEDTTQGYDWVSVQVLTLGAPGVVLLGLATGIGLLFVLALRRR